MLVFAGFSAGLCAKHLRIIVFVTYCMCTVFIIVHCYSSVTVSLLLGVVCGQSPASWRVPSVNWAAVWSAGLMWQRDSLALMYGEGQFYSFQSYQVFFALSHQTSCHVQALTRLTLYRYDIVFLPPSFPIVAMENPCLTFIISSILESQEFLLIDVIHEIAHGWFGNAVTNATWEEMWLSEGLATYAQRRITTEAYGIHILTHISQSKHRDTCGLLANAYVYIPQICPGKCKTSACSDSHIGLSISHNARLTFISSMIWFRRSLHLPWDGFPSRCSSQTDASSWR